MKMAVHSVLGNAHGMPEELLEDGSKTCVMGYKVHKAVAESTYLRLRHFQQKKQRLRQLQSYLQTGNFV